MKRLLLLVTLTLFTAVTFQNCAVPNQSTLSGSSTSSSTSTASSSSGSLTASMLTSPIYANGSTQVIANGGTSPYQYGIISGSGTINPTTGVYTAAASTGSVTAVVTDSVGNQASVTFSVIAVTGGSVAYTLIPVYRSYHGASGAHLVTASFGEANGTGYTYEGVLFNAFTSAFSAVAVYKCYNKTTNDYYVSNYSDCGGVGAYLGLIGYLEKNATNVVAYPVYRCVQSADKKLHLVTMDTTECVNNNYTVEGVLGYTK